MLFSSDKGIIFEKREKTYKDEKVPMVWSFFTDTLLFEWFWTK
jgi:hypothetical protein